MKRKPRERIRRSFRLACIIPIFGACGNTDFGRVRPSLTTDDMHAWVGGTAALSHAAPVSGFPLSDDERLLRDLAYPLIEPPYDRQRWYSVLAEYGLTRAFSRDWWFFDLAAYYTRLTWQPFRSATGRYQQLNEDVRNDVVRIDPFFVAARRVIDLDRKREMSLAYVTALTPGELFNARARIGENVLTVSWVHRSLMERADSYRFALERLVITTPSPMAVEVERSITLMKAQIARNQVAPVVAIPVAARPGLVTKD